MLKLNPFQKLLLTGYAIAILPLLFAAMVGGRNAGPLAMFGMVALTLIGFTFFFVKADK